MEEGKAKYFYTPEEFRQLMGCSKGLCYESLRQKKIRSFRLGKKYFIPVSEIERLTQSAESDGERQELDSDVR